MIQARAQRGNWGGQIEFLLRDWYGNTSLCGYAKDIIFEKKDDGTLIEPSFSMSYENAQQLMDDLWVCGLRPSEGIGSAGALAATEKHLDDMRKLVFDRKP